MALPVEQEERGPSFEHHAADSIPQWTEGGVTRHLVVGEVEAYRSAVTTFSPTVYEIYDVAPRSELTLPDVPERALCAVDGPGSIDGQPPGSARQPPGPMGGAQAILTSRGSASSAMQS